MPKLIVITGYFASQLVYLLDDYKRELETSIKSVEKINDNEYLVELKETIFYPGGGHQPKDAGIIKIKDSIYEVYNCERKMNKTLYYVRLLEGDRELREGDNVLLILNWERRYHIMKLHTAEHIFMHFMREKGYNLEDGSFGPEEGIIILDKKAPIEDLLEVEKRTNEIIREGLEVRREINNDRITIIIEKLDERFCGGTHVNNTKEIELFKITCIDDDGRIIRYNVGEKALNELISNHNRLINLGVRELAIRGAINLQNLSNKIIEIRNKLEKAAKELEIINKALLEMIINLPKKPIKLDDKTYEIRYADFVDLNLTPRDLRIVLRNLQKRREDTLYVIKLSPTSLTFVVKRSKRFYKEFRDALISKITQLGIGKDVKIASTEGALTIIGEKIDKLINNILA